MEFMTDLFQNIKNNIFGVVLTLLLAIAAYIVAQHMFPNKLDKMFKFLDTKFENPLYIRKTRKQLIKFVIGSFIVIFILSLLSVGGLAYILIFIWIMLGSVYLAFFKINSICFLRVS